MDMKFYIQRNTDNEVRVHYDSFNWDEDFKLFVEEYALNCNLHLFFERAGGIEPKEIQENDFLPIYDVIKMEFSDGTTFNPKIKIDTKIESNMLLKADNTLVKIINKQ